MLIRLASPTLLPTLRVSPIVGRNFAADEAFKGNDHVVMLDYKLAQRRYGAPAAALGQTVRLDGVDYQVIGVLPRGFFFDSAADVWLPASTTFDMMEFRNAHWLRMVARKKPGLSAGADPDRSRTASPSGSAKRTPTSTRRRSG